MTALIGFLREFTKEVAARSDRYAKDAAANGDPHALATGKAIVEIGEAIEAAMKRTLLA